MSAASDLLEHLRGVRKVKYLAESRSNTGWSGVGEGTVAVDSSMPNVIVFSESGTWTPKQGNSARFTNVFRWTMLTESDVRLEHLRFGAENPVHLFDLSFRDNGVWKPKSAHICSEDRYTAELHLHDLGINAHWSIEGPKKDETIRYEYRF